MEENQKTSLQQKAVLTIQQKRASIQNYNWKGLGNSILKRFLINRKLISTMLVVVFIFGFGFTKTISAKPGDLFFFSRTLYEKAIYNENEELDVLKLLKNRKEAFENLQKDSNCVQARIAEDELLDKYKLANSIIQNTQDTDTKIRVLTSYLEIFAISDLEMNCELIVNFEDLEQIWQFILINYSADSDLGVNFGQRIKSIDTRYNEYLALVKTNSDFTQDELNQINNLLIYISSNKIDEELTLDSYIKLINSEFAVKSIQNIITKQEKEDYWSTKIVILCNNIDESVQLCSKESLISNINSIVKQEQEVNRIENGSIQFRKYLDEGFLNVKQEPDQLDL